MLQQKPLQLVLGLHHSTACKAEELTATIQPGLHHIAMKWLFLASESLLFGLFIFFTHTSHHTHTHTHGIFHASSIRTARSGGHTMHEGDRAGLSELLGPPGLLLLRVVGVLVETAVSMVTVMCLSARHVLFCSMYRPRCMK